MVKLIGYNVVCGSFVDEETKKTVEYDNFRLFYVTDEVKVSAGMFCGTASAKRAGVVVIGASDIDACVGKEVLLVPDLRNPKYIAKIMVVK